MWFSLTQGAERRVSLRDVQEVLPGNDDDDCQLLVTTRAELIQTVALCTPKVVRLGYVVEKLDQKLRAGGTQPVDWDAFQTASGRSFELMLSQGGPVVVPFGNAAPASAATTLLTTIAETIRTCWAVPPDGARGGERWSLRPQPPTPLPADATKGDISSDYHVAQCSGEEAEVAIAIHLRMELSQSGSSTPRIGEGDAEGISRLHRRYGLLGATRTMKMELVRPDGRRTSVIQSTSRVDSQA